MIIDKVKDHEHNILILKEDKQLSYELLFSSHEGCFCLI